MEKRHGNIKSEQPAPSLGMEYFYLIIDGHCIGPFLSTGRLDCLEELLRLRGVRITEKGEA